MTSLLDMLKETDLRTHFSKTFKSATGRESLDPTTLQKRLLLCLYGLGTNTGLKQESGSDSFRARVASTTAPPRAPTRASPF
jgi:Tn3 transposase DDE domain